MVRNLILLLLLSGCAIGKQIPNWPALTVTEHRVSHAAMRDKCVQYTSFGSSPEACAEIDFAKGTCDIWFSADFPPQQWIIEHERLHCKGYEHVGDSTLKDALEKYRNEH